MIAFFLVALVSSDLVIAASPIYTGDTTELVLHLLPYTSPLQRSGVFPPALADNELDDKGSRELALPGAQKTIKYGRRKKAMMGLFGLATKSPQHKMESELQFPPERHSFISLRGKREFKALNVKLPGQEVRLTLPRLISLPAADEE